MELRNLETEQMNEASKHIDEMPTTDILNVINNEDQHIAQCVNKVIPKLSVLIDQIHERMLRGGRVFYIGAGTSGRLGVLDASECPPTYGVSTDLIKGLIAGGYPALLKAKEGAEDSLTLAGEDLAALNLSQEDSVIGLAASGRTPYVIGGLSYAKEKGALTASICCVSNAIISSYAQYPIECIVGPEVITGSTRMKAGTAQKLILNMISTSLMIKYGKVYHNLMVDVQPTNDKLVDRAIRIIDAATSCGPELAADYLRLSDNNVKVAICIALTGGSKEECLKYLDENKGNVSKTIHRFHNF